MGSFFGSLQFRSDDRDAVLRVLEPLASSERRVLCGPSRKGWVGAYPEGAGQDPAIADEAAARWPGHLLHLLVHDDDVFAYRYYREGELVDSYWSRPGYFGEEHHPQEEPLAGRPELLADLGVDPQRLRRILARSDGTTFESQRLAAFAGLLGIPNSATSYEYLEAGERHGVRGWKEFVHLPARPDAREVARQVRLARSAEVAALRDKGLLLVDVRLNQDPHTWGQQPVTVKVRGREIEIRFRPDERKPLVHPSGVIVGRSAEELLLFEAGTSSPHLRLRIGRDQQPDPSSLKALFGSAMAEVPMVGETVLPLLLAVVPTERHAEAEEVFRPLMTGGPLDRTARMSLAQLAMRFTRDAGSIVAMLLSQDGRWLFCGTSHGVLAFAWNDVLNTPDGGIAPWRHRYSVRPEQLEANWSGAYVYGLAHDAARGLLLFAGKDGRIRSLSLADGATGDVVDPVGRPPILAMRLLDEDLLATWSAPGFPVTRGRSEKPIVQVWDYAALRATRSPLE